MRRNSSYKKLNGFTHAKKRGISAHVCNCSSSSEFTVKQTAVYLAVLMLTGWMANSVMAEPTGGVVKSGAAQIDKTGNAGQTTTTVNQSSNSLSLEWQSFNLGKTETVNFVQPSTNSVAINRILSASGSDIQGKINANGKVWLINPNGVFFGKDAQVNVGGLVATTLDNLTNISGGQKFQGNSISTVENQGNIVSTNGYVVLMGHTAKNLGTIKADGGTAALAAGSDITLQFQNNPRISVVVNQNQLNALASNLSGGLIQANGGQVMLNAGASNSILSAAVNNSGILLAKTTVTQNGKIALSADGLNSRMDLAGTLDASASGNLSGGTIETKASNVRVADLTQVNTKSDFGSWGKWTITQNNTAQLAADANLSSIFSGNVLNDSLNYSNVTIATKKDITVDIPLTWNAASKLTLNADQNIDINATITSNNNQGSLALAYGQGSSNGKINGAVSNYDINASINLKEGQNFSTVLGSAGARKDFYVITKLGAQGSTTGQDLQGMNGNLQRNYALGGDIDATATEKWGPAFVGGTGFNPIGGTSIAESYQGVFEGLGHTVNGLNIIAPTSDVMGLFGYVYKGEIRNTGLTNLSISGKTMTGGFAGILDAGSIKNSYTTGSISGEANVGGLAGMVTGGSVYSSHSSASVTSTGTYNGVGGLVGYLERGQIIKSYSDGTVEGNNSVGGLAGSATQASIDQSYSMATIKGGDVAAAGGLVGMMQYSKISASFTDIKIKGSNDLAGGLVGNALTNNIVSDSYAVGSVEGANVVGGLIAKAGMLNQINRSFASAKLEGNYSLGGGLVGLATGRTTITNSYWDESKYQKGYTLLSATSINSRGLTSDQMMQKANFAGFDTASQWTIYEGHTMPLLQNFMTPLTLKIKATQGQTYNASNQYSGEASIENIEDVSKLLGSTNFVLSSKNAGTQAVIDSGLYSTQLGYLVKFDTSLSQVEIAKASLNVSGITADNKVYDGSQAAQLNFNMQNTGIFAADQGTVAISLKGTFDSKNVGDGRTVQIDAMSSGSNSANYSLTWQKTATANITPATYTTLSGTKTYDGNNQFSNLSLAGVNGEQFLLDKASSNSVNASSHPLNAATAFVQADGVKEIAGDLGKISNYLPLDIKQLKNNHAVINQAEYTAISGSKVYDGNNTFNQATLTGVNNEKFNVNALSDSKNASVNTINPSSKFTGLGSEPVAASQMADINNYKPLKSLDGLASNSAQITPKTLVANGIVAENKIYDGNTSAVVNVSKAFAANSGLVEGDEVVVKNIDGQFSGKNSGVNKNVVLSNAVYDGVDKGNYTIIDQQNSIATISPKDLIVSGLKAADKVYDGNKTAMVVTDKAFGANSGLIEKDDVKVASVTGTFNDKNVGPNKTVVLSNAVYEGIDKGNYNIIEQQSSIASITPKKLTVDGLKVADKVYDGNRSAAVATDQAFSANSGLIANDDVKVAAVSGTFSNKDAGDKKTVLLSNAVYDGVDKGNYIIIDQTVSTANISKAELTYKADQANRFVNQVVTGLTGSVTGFVEGEKLEKDTSGNLAWTTDATIKSEAGRYAVTGSGLVAANYKFTQHAENSSALTLIDAPQINNLNVVKPIPAPRDEIVNPIQNNQVVIPKLPPSVVIQVPTVADISNDKEKSKLKIRQDLITQFALLDEDYWDSNCSFMRSVNGKCMINKKTKPDQINNLRSLINKPGATNITLR